MEKTHYKIFLCFLSACSIGSFFTSGILACLCTSSRGTLEEKVVTALDENTLVFTGLVISITPTPPEEYKGIIKYLSLGFSDDGQDLVDMDLEVVQFIVLVGGNNPKRIDNRRRRKRK